MEMELWNIWATNRIPGAIGGLTVIIAVWVAARFSSVASEQPEENKTLFGTIQGQNGVITASVVDTRDSTSNLFEIELDKENSCQNEFNFVVSIPNLKLLPGDYFVSISSKLISNWPNSNYPVEYFIALEKNSTFNV